MDLAAKLIAMLIFSGAGLFCLWLFMSVGYVAIGFTGSLRQGIPLMVVAAIGTAFFFWLAYWFSPFTIAIS